MSFNPNFNPKFNGNGRNFHNNGNNHNQYQNHNQHQTQSHNPVQQNAQTPFLFNNYLNEVRNYCSQAGLIGLTRLSVQSAMQIVLIADRLRVDRVQALKEWSVASKGQVVISSRFLAELFSSRNLLNKKVYALVLERLFKNKNEIADKITIMNALRSQFPDLLMGVICPEEIPPSKLSKLKKIVKANPSLTAFVMVAGGLGIWFQFSHMYLSLLALTTIFCITKYKRLSSNRYFNNLKSAIVYLVKKVHSFVGSCLVDCDNNSIPKTTKLNIQPQEEEMYLDLEHLEVVKPKSAYNTTPLKSSNKTNVFDGSNKTNILEPNQTSFIN